MKTSYYIIAAKQLGLIPEKSGYGLEAEYIITPENNRIEVSNQIKTRAKYLEDLAKIRLMRDSILSSTDWVGNIDVPENELVTKLRIYRQELRNITTQIIEGEELLISWPIDPRWPELNE